MHRVVPSLFRPPPTPLETGSGDVADDRGNFPFREASSIIPFADLEAAVLARQRPPDQAARPKRSASILSSVNWAARRPVWSARRSARLPWATSMSTHSGSLTAHDFRRIG